MLDELAEEIGMDPVDFRLKNIPLQSQARSGNPKYSSTGLEECIRRGAEAGIDGAKGKRKVPVSEIHVPPSRDPRRETVLERGEILTEVRISPPSPGLYTSYLKVRARRAWDFALAGVALAIDFRDGTASAGIVLSGATPVPWRSEEAEAAISGARITPETAEKAAEAAMREATPLKDNAYKIPLFRGVITEELLQAAEVAG